MESVLPILTLERRWLGQIFNCEHRVSLIIRVPTRYIALVLRLTPMPYVIRGSTSLSLASRSIDGQTSCDEATRQRWPCCVPS